MTAAPKEDADLGLNLVFSAPSSTSAAAAPIGGLGTNGKKPKRKTKYDRRRERGRLAKLAKDQEKKHPQTKQQPRQQRGGTGSAVENGGSSLSSSLAGIAAAFGSGSMKSKSAAIAPSVESVAAEPAEPANAAVVEAEDGISKMESANREDENDDAEESKSSSREITPQSTSSSAPSSKEDDNYPKETTTLNNKPSVAEPTASSPPPLMDTAQPVASSTDEAMISSRRHRSETAQTEEERAQYLSEFHARPRDLDRNERASKDIKASCASDHIFGNGDAADDDNDDEGEDDTTVGEHAKKESKDSLSNNELETKATSSVPSCPFRKLGLHSHLVSTLTSPTGAFRLSQPTIVQTRSVAALLPNKRKNHKSKHGKKLERNLFIQSETGSGKTLAYLLPILQHLAVDDGDSRTTGRLKRIDRQLGGTRAILLCPTRELATQTYAMANALCRASYSWIVPGCFSGGEKRKSEKARLRKGVTILIATPGRLLDHLSKTESLMVALKNRLEWLVLDEADRLLDAGLGGQVEQIVQHLRSNQPGAGPKRDGVTWRSVLVSATVTGELQGLANKMLGGDGWMWARGHANAAASSGGTGGGQSGEEKPSENDEDGKSSSDRANDNCNELDNAAPRQLAQLYMVVSAKLRLSSLLAFLSARAAKGERMVVFLSTCDSVDYHHGLFTAMECILGDADDRDDDNGDEDGNKSGSGIFGKKCPIYKLHGDIPHNQRQSTLKAFNDDDSSILLATDVAARGLNFPALDWIVQYDPPCETKDYVHRAGRSARAGKAGHALLFLLPSERQYVEVLQLRGLEEISALSLSATLTGAASVCGGIAREGEAKAGGGNNFLDSRGEAFTTAIQNRLEQCVIQDDIDYKVAIEKKSKGDPKQVKQKRRKKKDMVGPLLEGARKAFSAFVRAYPAKEKAVRHIFNARALHLGHIARSLALKETPKMVSKGNNSKDKNATRDKSQTSRGKRGEKRKSRLTFGNDDDEDQEDDSAMAIIEDEERDRNLSLLGDAIGSSSRKSHANKKIKTSAGGGGKNVQKRMMEAAMMMQAQEFM
mmetsp:Transcript_5559/g.12115  ORF Transcript_5559/g.12115 Transcript_5559/m.12115 type:complete len:1053 (+) Transcript_5559:55-3213(+)